MKHIFFVITLAYSSFLIGMEIVSASNKNILTNRDIPNPIISRKQEFYLSLINNHFFRGIDEYKKGNTKVAGHFLYTAYIDIFQQNLGSFINEYQLQRLYRLISLTQRDQGNFTLALTFAETLAPEWYHHYNTYSNNNDNPQEYTIKSYAYGLTDTGIIYQYMAKKALLEKKDSLAQEYYKNAFILFEKALQKDQNDWRARKYYEYSLKNSLGCVYDISRLSDYYFKELSYTQNHYHYDRMITQLLQLAITDPSIYCKLAELPLKQKSGFPSISYEQSLEYSQKAIEKYIQILSLSTGQSLSLHRFLVILEKLCTSCPDRIKKDFMVIQKYGAILSVVKNQISEKINEICATPHTTPLSLAVTQILCYQTDDETIKSITSLPFEHEYFTTFYDSEGFIAIPLLRHMLTDHLLSPEKRDLLHILIGGYEYHHKNFDAALTHFKQYSNYKNDIYLQTITLDFNSENIQDHVKPLEYLLRKKGKQISSERGVDRKKIIDQKFGCDRATSPEEKIRACTLFLAQYIDKTSKNHILAELRFLLTFHDICTNTSPDIQKKSVLLKIYFDFFSHLKAKDKHSINQLLSSSATSSLSLRPALLKAFANHKKDEIKQFVFEDKLFNELCLSDGFIFIPLLQKILQNTNQDTSITPNQCHYLLGGYEYISNNYAKAYEHFSRCQYKDLYTQSKRIQTNLIPHRIKDIHLLPTASDLRVKNLKPLSKNLKKTVTQSRTYRNTIAKNILASLCNNGCLSYIKYLLSFNLYHKAYKHIHSLSLLQLPTTYYTLGTAFAEIEKYVPSQAKVHFDPLQIPERAQTIKEIQNINNQEHNEYLCEYLIAHLLQRIDTEKTDSTHIEIQRECLPYLQCSFKHMNVDTIERENRQKLCGKILCNIAHVDKSIILFDQAIELGYKDAFYYKSTFLSQLSSSQDTLAEQINLLEQHSQSDSPIAELSLKKLGLYFSHLPGLENQKKSFLYLSKIKQIDSDIADSLAFFYITGIQEDNGEWFQEQNMEKAEEHLSEILKNNSNPDDFYYHTLLVRSAIRYKQNKLSEAYHDLSIVLIKTKSIKHKACAMWRMGIIELLITEKDSILQNTVNLLHEAFNILFDISKEEVKSINPVEIINEFELCNDASLMNLVQKKVDIIISQEKTDIISLLFCAIIGKVIIEQKNATSEQRKFAQNCLLYAAQNNCLDAQIALFSIPEQELNFCNKIYCLENFLYHNKDLANNPGLIQLIDPLLKNTYPKRLLEQIRLIIHFAEKNPDLLREYLSKIYKEHLPERIDLSTLDQSFSSAEMETLIDTLLTIDCLKKNADSFVQKIKEKQVITSLEYFCAIFCGSLLSYSTNPQRLISGAKYLLPCVSYETEHPRLFHIKINLASIYYTLGCQYQNQKNLLGAVSFLLKGAQLGNVNSILILSKLLLDGIPEAQKDAVEIISLLQRFHIDNPTHVTEALLKRHMEQMKPKPNTEPFIVTCLNPQILSIIEKQKSHISYKDLVYNPQIVPYFKIDPLVHTPTDNTLYEICKEYVDQKKKEPYAYLYLIINNPSIYANSTYLTEGITHGLIKTSDQSNTYVFKNLAIVNILCQILVNTFKNKNSVRYKTDIFKTIKTLLINKIDIMAFEAFCNEFYGLMLTNIFMWKKIKK